MAVIDVREFGAKGDGAADDHAALQKALTDADAAGGGTVFLPTGTYAISKPLRPRNSGRPFSRVCLIGDGDRASTVLATGDFAPITGHWMQCRIENLVIDAGGYGSPGLVVDLDKSYLRHCWIDGWSECAISLNPNTIGLLNWVDDNFVEQRDGTGIQTTHRFFDSWIVNNNVGSTGPNLSLESGPVRVLANHLNGSPRHNIELRGTKSLTIIGNICEGARREAIIYAMPDWMDDDSEQVQIVANNITNGGKEDAGRYPAIGIYSRSATHRTSAFNITGNYFANLDDGAGWSYAVEAPHVDVLSIVGNQWDNNGFTRAPVRVGGRAVSVAGNTSGNDDSRTVATLRGATNLTAVAGEYVGLLPQGAKATLPDATANGCRYTLKNIGETPVDITADGRIDGTDKFRLPAGAAADFVSDGSTWWSLR